MTMLPRHKSIFGEYLSVGRATGEFYTMGHQITPKAVKATISVGAESSDVRAITIQLYDAKGKAIAYNELIEVGVYKDATPTDFVATGGSTGIAIGANGKLQTVIAKKLFRAITDNTGKLTLTWTDTGTETFAIGVRLPNGMLTMSTAQANA